MKLPGFVVIMMFIGATAMAQERTLYPDSLRGIVLKAEPLSFLYDHISFGIEIPLGNTFLDINIGKSGLTNTVNQQGGFVSKVGVKIPIRSTSPFSILYLMPELAHSRYKMMDYATNNNPWLRVNATAVMLCLGYRHLNPSSHFYYDGGVDLGYGWANQAGVYDSYNFILNGNDYSDPSQPSTNTTGTALSCHFAIGILIKPKPSR